MDVLETEIFYGYRGLMAQYDTEMAKALLGTAHAQKKVSDKLFEAIMSAHGEGNIGARSAIKSVGAKPAIDSDGELIFNQGAPANARN